MEPLELVPVLIQAGSSVNYYTPPLGDIEPRDGFPTALWCAVGNDDADIVRALIEAGAHVNPPQDDGLWTPLMAACRCGYAEVVRALYREGARRVEACYGPTGTGNPGQRGRRCVR